MNEPVNKWTAYKIDYEYGTAVLLSRESLIDPLEYFYHLASQCFGIRKSIGTTTLMAIEEANLDSVSLPEDKSVENHPELYDNPLSKILKVMGQKDFTIPRELENTAKYILIHSGGDLIAWSDRETKLKSEWD